MCMFPFPSWVKLPPLEPGIDSTSAQFPTVKSELASAIICAVFIAVPDGASFF